MNEIVYSTIKRNYTALDIETLEIIAEAYRILQQKKLYTEEEALMKFKEYMEYRHFDRDEYLKPLIRDFEIWWVQQNK